VAIKTDKNLLVAALQAAGFTVYAINPRAVVRYRERSAQAGGKSDPGDAQVLANVLRTDRHVNRALREISEVGLAVKALARQHQEAIWARQLTVNRLRSVLCEFYANAMAESFFATLECELLDRSTFENRNQARLAIFDFIIETFYNPHRRHSSIGNLSPAEYERRWHANPTARKAA
jgi:transposase InsO family protein